MSSVLFTIDETQSSLTYQGSKTDWRTRANLELLLIEHHSFKCMEFICYNSTVSIESPRLYLNIELLFTKFNPDEFEEAMRLKKEIFLRQKKTPDIKVLTEELNRKFAVQYILLRLFVKEGKPFEIGLKALSTDQTREKNVIDHEGNVIGTGVQILDIIMDKMPSLLPPTEVQFPKAVTNDDFDHALRKFRKEQNALTRDISYADMAVNSIEGFKEAMSGRMQMELELKRSYNPARLMWVNAINKVLILNYIEKVKIRLAEIEMKAVKKRLDEEKRLKVTTLFTPNKPQGGREQRITMDNSQISVSRGRLPPVRSGNSSPQSPSLESISQLHSPSSASLPPIDEWHQHQNNQSDISFKARRRQRAIYNESKSFMVSSLSPSQSDKNIRIPTIEEIVENAAKMPPSVTNSYSEYAYNKIKNDRSSVRLESINRRKMSSISFDESVSQR